MSKKSHVRLLTGQRKSGGGIQRGQFYTPYDYGTAHPHKRTRRPQEVVWTNPTTGEKRIVPLTKTRRAKTSE